MSAHLVQLAQNIVAEMNADASFYDVKGQAQAGKLAEDQGAYDAAIADSRAAYVEGRASLHASHLDALTTYEAEKNAELAEILGQDGDAASLGEEASLKAVIQYINDWDGTTDGLVASAKAAEEARLNDYIAETGINSDSAFDDAYAAAQA